jgi:hypothetical protein
METLESLETPKTATIPIEEIAMLIQVLPMIGMAMGADAASGLDKYMGPIVGAILKGSVIELVIDGTVHVKISVT